MQSVELTETEEILAVTLASLLYALLMAFSLVRIAGIEPLSRVLKLVYFTSLAAMDFYSDLLYIFTQTFVNRYLFIVAIVVAFAPTLAYLTSTGLFWSFFSKMIPASTKAAMGVWVIAFCGVEGLEVCGQSLPEQPWLWIVLIKSSDILREAVKQWRLDFAEGGDDFLKVLLYFVKFLLTFAFGVVVLALGVVGCAAMLVVTPAVAAGILVCGPVIGMIWCLVHVNFKLSIFPGATANFYLFMQHDPPDPASTRSMNLSFFAEIVCESLPQFGILVINELALASSRPQGSFEGAVTVFTLVSSALDLLSNFWPYLVWTCRYGSVSKALDEVLYIVTDDHARIVKERNQKRREQLEAKL